MIKIPTKEMTTLDNSNLIGDYLVGAGALAGLLEKKIEKSILIGRNDKEEGEDKEESEENEVNILFNSQIISRKHCRIIQEEVKDGGGLFIIDSSKNGTYINGEKIPKEEKVGLKQGDLIDFGKTNYKAYYYNGEKSVESNLEKMFGNKTNEMIYLLNKENLGGTGGYYEDKRAGTANFYFNPKNGEIKVFTNYPPEERDLLSGSFRVFAPVDKHGCYKIFEPACRKRDLLAKSYPFEEAEKKSLITHLAKEVLLKSVDFYNRGIEEKLRVEDRRKIKNVSKQERGGRIKWR